MREDQEARGDVWLRWNWLWEAIFYGGFIAAGALLALTNDRALPLGPAPLLTAALLLWHWGGLRLAYRFGGSWEERPYTRLIVIIGDIALWFALVSTSTVYYLALFGLFPQVFRHLPLRYAIPSTLLLTAAIVSEQLADASESFSLTNPTVWPYAFIGLAGILLGVWLSAIIAQSTQRRQLIEQLEAAQVELAAAERREGVLEERQRLSREIHDTLAQGFTSIVMHLEAAEQALPDDMNTLQRHLNQARDTARDSLGQARRVVQDLRPDLLEQRSLPDAIERTAARWSEETGLPVTTLTTGDPIPLHPEMEVTLLRAAQEALANIRKHARAGSVQLTLSYMGDVIILDVQDDGVGLDEAEPSPHAGGYGLQGMRERVELCGGSVTLESEAGEGTTVVVSIPVPG
jgi:signal transduction histidine kinase